MTDWFYLLTLTIVGCCDAFGLPEPQTNLKHSSSWMKDLRASSRPRKKFPNLLQREPNKRRFSSPDCLCRTENLVENQINTEPNWSARSNTNWPISHRNKGDRLSWYHRSRSEPINDFDQGINGYDFNSRRLFWEPIFDGKIIGSVGSLFSEDIKKEANRERIERENMRNEALRKKYVGMLNDPVKLAELKRESDNSPSYINQVIRRSFGQKFDKNIGKDGRARKPSSSQSKFDYTRSKQAKRINDRHKQSDSQIFFKIIDDQSEESSESEISKKPDNSTPRVRGMPMDFLPHQGLIAQESERSRKNVGKTSDSVYPPNWVNPLMMMFRSRFNEMDKRHWNSPCGSTDDVIPPINSFPRLIPFSQGRDLELYIPNETPSKKTRPEDYPQRESSIFDTCFDNVPIKRSAVRMRFWEANYSQLSDTSRDSPMCVINLSSDRKFRYLNDDVPGGYGTV